MRTAHAVLLLLPLCSHFTVGCEISSYDFIVVGGGTAGLVVANRLSENPDVQVLIVEAGYSALNDTNSTFPELGPGLSINVGPLNWNYVSEPQEFADGKTKVLAAGKGIGGTSLINGMQYLRAQKSQIDAWERAGNEGWNWDALFPYYKKGEQLKAPTEVQLKNGAAFEPQFHGFEGPLHTGWPRAAQQNDYFLTVKETFENLNVPFNSDPGGGETRGVATFPRTITPGNETVLDVRADSARSYYYPVQDRPNLHMMAGTTALRLLWEQSNYHEDAVANAVEVLLPSGEHKFINATSEVIVSCGSFRSAPLLEHSGVGNPTILSKYDIETVVDLPGVGENLVDQTLQFFFFSAPPGSNYTGSSLSVAYLSVADLFGPNSTESFASSVQSSLSDYAVKIAEGNNGAANKEDVLELLKIQYSMLFEEGVPCVELLNGAGGPNFTAEMWGTMPFSRGNVHIKSANPLDLPSINPRYWQLEYDLTTQVRAIRYVRELYGTAEPLKELVHGEGFPGTDALPVDADDETMTAWLRGQYFTVYHNIGTAAMLPRKMGGVTNERCRVWGTTNVRVVDASILPFQTTGHPSSTIYAVAERCSDLINQDLRSYRGKSDRRKKCSTSEREGSFIIQ